MLDESVYKKRMEKVHQKIEETEADFAFLTPSPSFQYFAGYEYQMRERLVALLVPRGTTPSIVVPAFEESDHRSHTWISDFLTWSEDENPYTMIAETLDSSKKTPSVLLDNTLPLGVYWNLENAFGGFKKTESITPMVDKMRISKTEDELELMKKAGHIIDVAVMNAFSQAQLGMTELEVQRLVHDEILRQDATPTFAAVLFGEKSALPHAGPGSKTLKKGDVILMDCGCSLDGYNTDMTRCGVAGEPTKEIETVHSIVLKAQEAAIATITNGMNCGTADGIARRIIEDEGYGDNFTHRLGHGIGLEVHEHPYLVRGSPEVLEQGMCFSIEPGIYLEGKFGIRCEDLACVRQNGIETITYSPRDLIILDL